MSNDRRKIATLYHADLDGRGSAYAIWKALKDTCELLFIPVQYGQEPPYEKLNDFGPAKIFIVDFSYDAVVLSLLQHSYTQDITVIDHHRTSLPELMKWAGVECTARPGTYHSVINEGGGSFFHDETLAGCVLTWNLFHLDPDWNPEENAVGTFRPSLPPPELLLYVQDRDLWKFELENSKEINAYIATMEESFEVWDDFYTPEAYDCGKAILAFQSRQIKSRLKDVRLLAFDDSELGGMLAKVFGRADKLNILPRIPFVNCSENISEVGEAMCLEYPDSPFSVSYCDRADGNRSYSLRSRFGFDVSAVAKAFGGGGHPGAAGFTLAAPDII